MKNSVTHVIPPSYIGARSRAVWSTLTKEQRDAIADDFRDLHKLLEESRWVVSARRENDWNDPSRYQ